MARKPAPRPARRGPSPAKRVEQALGERRYADALKLAKQLDRDQPSAAHRGLLRTAYLRAAEDLARRDAFRDGHALLSEAEQLSADDPEWWASLAVLRAEFGDWRRAFELLERAPDARARVEAALADRALREPAPRPELLPPELRPAHDLVRAAFAHYEAGRDDAMLQALQGVGLRSPFLDWKLLLRGLSAYSRREDERAVENWQRLDPHRLPARLAAPLRLAIDPGFREAQPAEALRALQARLDRLLPAGDLLAGLRAIDRELHRERGLAEAFRAAERLTRPLRREHPALLRRLADCLYWAITRQGRPEDMGRFLRAFGPPEHDPHFYRLQGIVLEAIGDLDQANKAWNDYQRWIAATPAQWPKPQADLARAMVWYRMGRNAQAHLRADFDEEEDVLDFLFGAPRRRPQVRPLKPTAEACFEKAAELAPDWPDPAIELMRDHLDAGRTAKAARLAPTLAERFPEHLPALEILAEHHQRMGEVDRTVELLRRALRANPLDRSLRRRLGLTYLGLARRRVGGGDLDGARAALGSALEFAEGPDAQAVQVAWSALERKAGDAAEARRRRELATRGPEDRPAVVYRLLVETILFKLPRPAKPEMDREFAEVLASPLTPAEAGPLVDALETYKAEPEPYRGLKTHEKKIQDLVRKSLSRDSGEEALVRLGESLLRLRWLKVLEECAEQGMRRFPQSPYFPFLLAERFFALGPNRAPVYRVLPLLRQAQKLAGRLPPSERKRALQERIAERRREFAMQDRFWPEDDDPEF